MSRSDSEATWMFSPESGFTLVTASDEHPPPSSSPSPRPTHTPNTHAVDAGGRSVFLRPGLDTALTTAKLPAPVNFVALNKTMTSVARHHLLEAPRP
ncbi:hypothetical protein C8R44DRAFT_872583 [Mycena epipterygia]|nr:hypothetical protein C8R44DRAFT_872583 [Mycena epipterygia]